MNIPVYPNDFSSYQDGVDMPDSLINQWIREAITYFEETENSGRTYIVGSGNTKVIVRKYENEYDVTVAKGYNQANIFFD